LIAIRLWDRQEGELMTFLASATYICGMLTSAAFGLYPYMLASNGDPSLGLTIYNAAAPEYRLSIGLRGWIPGWFWRRLISFLCIATLRERCDWRTGANKRALAGRAPALLGSQKR
jgi:hypothetical protein